MTNLQMIKNGFDVAPILQAIEKHSKLWQEKTFRQEYVGSAHRDTETIYLRWARRDTRQDIQETTVAINCEALHVLPEARLLILSALKAVRSCCMGRVIIVALRPGGIVKEHCDEGKYADHFERFHLCLSANDAEFFVRDQNNEIESVKMGQGELWWFNHKRSHWAENKTDHPRIHMIIDAVAPDYRRARVA